MNARRWLAIIIIMPVVIIFWVVMLFEILFYPYTAIVVGLLANGQWIDFKEYLYEEIGIPFGG